MSTKKSVPAAPKARKSRSPGMTAAQKFDVMSFVRNADASIPNATLAEQATDKFGRKITSLQIKGYRAAFGLPSVGRPKAADLQAQLAEAKAEIERLRAQSEAVAA